ncbi:amidohydrolase [Methanoculleus bourgensis]|jgi:5-methylthioadenosine/S-adenosylhomocysteine deaminase|uniref:5'-deoxyadenosine deaminase n=2 Tax=Methanoculleus bourgensis TaxID=83986 RepID=A0A8T7HEW8_9EURY|nr:MULTISPECIES: amidohydrolase [Methanoculleus]MBT0733605.1 amidohydrolase [Methanoculleus bourgensis]MDD3372676.1 amidohydrolase [Methanoculleus bourgensis]NQS78878.1 amidohydrolase [Methanoculleus bourgensis]SAI88150.1 hydrolase [Methanoculleus bourgensis]
MNDIFTARGSVLIAGVTVNGSTVDIAIDEEGMIAGIGKDARKTIDADIIIDGSDRVAIPGLVNTHTHAAMTLLRGYADDMPLAEWLSEKIWPLEAHLSGDDVYWGTKLACLEMIKSGTVAFNDMYFFMERAADAVDEMGLRATLAYGFIDLGMEEKREAEIKATEALVAHVKARKNPRIQAAVGPHSVYTVSPEGLSWCANFAEEQEIGIHIHLSETEKEVTDCVAEFGKRPAVHLDECGCLTPRTVAAHCCWLDEAECRLLGKRGVHASHNPASNMKLAVNRAMPYHWLKTSGANVCLGTDGCASNNSLDLMEEMKFAALLQKFAWNSQTLLPAGEAVAMATSAGARALGTGPGTLTAGAPADIVLLDARAVCNTPLHNSDSNTVYACNGGAVMTVLCQGRVLMHERTVPGEEEIVRGAAAAAQALVGRAREA